GGMGGRRNLRLLRAVVRESLTRCRQAFGSGSPFTSAFSLPLPLTWPVSNDAIVRSRCGPRRYVACSGSCCHLASAWSSPKRKGRTVHWISLLVYSLCISSALIT